MEPLFFSGEQLKETFVSYAGAVVRSDARPPGMRTVADSILTNGNILSWRLVMK